MFLWRNFTKRPLFQTHNIGSIGLVYLPTNLPYKSTINVGIILPYKHTSYGESFHQNLISRGRFDPPPPYKICEFGHAKPSRFWLFLVTFDWGEKRRPGIQYCSRDPDFEELKSRDVEGVMMSSRSEGGLLKGSVLKWRILLENNLHKISFKLR